MDCLGLGVLLLLPLGVPTKAVGVPTKAVGVPTTKLFNSGEVSLLLLALVFFISDPSPPARDILFLLSFIFVTFTRSGVTVSLGDTGEADLLLKTLLLVWVFFATDRTGSTENVFFLTMVMLNLCR